MRNLVLYDLTRHPIRCGLTGITDALLENKIVYLVINGSLFKYDINETTCICILEEHRVLTRICLITFGSKIWFGTGNAFVYYSPELNTNEVIQSPEEFSAAVWSPTQEYLAVLSIQGQVLMYTFDNTLKKLKCIGSYNISASITNVSSNVGWGSSDTQFRGSQGKSSALENIQEKVTEVHDKTPRIIWRTDQAYFLINYWKDGKRIFKVFQFPSTPVYACEDTPGLQAPISWMCTENMIACPVYTDKLRITVFEKNGLSRHSFDLYDQIEVVDLQWNPTGEILAVHQSDNRQSFLSLYKINNHCWYLKQRLDFTEKNPLTSFKWIQSPNSIFELVVSTAEEIINYQFIYKIYRSRKPYLSGKCAVVDGNKVLMYNYADAVIPPPDVNEVIELKNPVTHVLFHPEVNEVLMIDCKYYAYWFKYEDKHIIKQERSMEIPIEFKNYPCNIRYFYWDNNITLFAIGIHSEVSYFDIILKSDINFKFSEHKLVCPKTNYIELIGERESFLKLCVGEKIYLGNERYCDICSPSLILHIDTYICGNRQLVFALNLAKNLYLGNTCIADNVTSFLIRLDYLYFTTEDKMCCLKLKKIEDNNFIISINNSYWSDVEKGAILISGIPNGIDLVLQMPRGNIEINTCQIAAVDKLDNFLKQDLWKESYEFIRLEKLDINLLIDLNPPRFFQKISKFLTTVNSGNWITGFILNLVEENVLHTIYQNYTFETSFSITNKKRTVCEAIVCCLDDVDITTFIKVIMIASMSTNGIVVAVKHLREIYILHKERNIKAVVEGLKFLSVHFSMKDICEAALSTYDPDFALFVYSNSSMDPKIYKPLIEEFSTCQNEDVLRFKVNDYLGLHKEALTYLAKNVCSIRIFEGNYNVDDVTPLVEYAMKYNLETELNSMCTTSGLFVREVSLAYASYLHSQHHHKEAGIIYSCTGYGEEALGQYKLCGQWQEALFLVEKINVSDARKKAHILEIGKGLECSNKFKDAAILYEIYLEDYELAISTFLKGKMFSDAKRVAQKFGHEDLIETTIKTSFVEYAENLLKKLDSTQNTFNKYKSRLKIVREIKIKAYLARNDEVIVLDDDTTDTISASSSKWTQTTGPIRARRKKELRQQNLREGGYYEDIALMRALHKLISETFELGPEVGSTCHFLMLYKMLSVAKDLQNLLEDIQIDMTQNLTEIWPEWLNSFDAPQNNEVKALRENFKLLDVTYRVAPELSNTPWKINLCMWN